MEKYHLSGVAEEDSDLSPEDNLVMHDMDIVALVRHAVRTSSMLTRMNLLDLDISEIEQRVRIKYWKALQSTHIEYHRGYIRKIAYHEIADLMRQRKPSLPFQTNEDGELYMGDMLVMVTGEMVNPEEAFLDDESFHDVLERYVAILALLPPRQRRVMACRLYEELGERLDVKEALERHSIDAEMCRWPEGELDKKLLKASHSAARKKVTQMLTLIQREYHTEKIGATPEKATQVMSFCE